MAITKKYLLAAAISAIALTPNKSISKPITIAVIDTGIDKDEPNLCKFGHKSFVGGNPLVDRVGHGTHIAGLINRNIGENRGDFCLVSIKWHENNVSGVDEVTAMRKAIQYAININVDYINISAGGSGPREDERKVVLNALNKGITVVAAAGNEFDNMDQKCDYYPACYDNRIITVGNLEKMGSRAPSSNYGNYVKRWEVGTNVVSDFPNGVQALLTGTSQSTAVATGKLVHDKLNR